MQARTKRVLLAKKYLRGYAAGLRMARRIVKDAGPDWESALRNLKSLELRIEASNAQPTKGVPA